jgi:hypothetical protein
MQVNSLSWECEKGNVDILKEFQLETLSLIACIGYPRFECFVRGASKNDGEYQKNGECP